MRDSDPSRITQIDVCICFNVFAERLFFLSIVFQLYLSDVRLTVYFANVSFSKVIQLGIDLPAQISIVYLQIYEY